MTTTCINCGRDYPTLYKRTNQGDMCSSFVSNEGVKGEYGSRAIDMEVYEWRDGIPDSLQSKLDKNPLKNVLCDSCVKDLLRDRDIVFSHKSW